MKKRLLSIFTSASLVASALAMGAGAAPSVAGTHESVAESFVPEMPYIEEAQKNEDAVLSFEGPRPVTVADFVIETNTEFGTPEFFYEATLMSELSGDGTEESPYLIGTAEELKAVADLVNSGKGSTAFYKLTADIDLGGIEWIPIGHYTQQDDKSTAFRGTFDGDGHTVSNFNITKDDTAYIGLFGIVSDGNIKNVNVDNATISISSKSTQKLYAGILVGRLLTTEENGSASITHSNVTNSSIKISSDGTIYGGGIVGVVLGGNYKGANNLVAFCNAECDIDISTSAKNQYYNTVLKVYERHMVIAGGITAYLSAQTNATVTVINCNATGNLKSSAINSIVAQSMAGGVFGDARTVDIEGAGGKLTIDSCSGAGSVYGESEFYPYVVGGFVGQIYSTKNLFISNCFSSADVSGKFSQSGNSRDDDPTAGGFAGQIFFPDYNSSYGRTIKNCYASGDVRDMDYSPDVHNAPGIDYYFVGGFTGYSMIALENCFRFETQIVVGDQILETLYSGLKILSAEEEKFLDKYTGFDFNKTWQMDPEAEYFYPTLQEKIGFANFVSGGLTVATEAFGANGKVSAPSVIPTKSPTLEKVFTFNYWSLSEDGAPFNFGGEALTKDTVLYAVFKSEPRPYKLRFVSEGINFIPEQTLTYGSFIKAPTSVPSKADDEVYFYTFLHWSDTPNGSAFDFTDYTIVGNTTFYAVFEQIDKRAWRGDVAEEFSSGAGIETNPYIIKTADEFALFEKLINEKASGYTEAYYKLGADINLGNNYWRPIGNSVNHPFSANLDGAGYSVSHFKVASGQYGGLFGVIFNGNVKNLKVSDFNIEYSIKSSKEDAPAFVGGLAAYITSERDTTNISGIQVSSFTINIDAAIDYVYAGGLAGYASAYISGKTYISDSFVNADIKVVNSTGYNYMGGLAGKLDTGSTSLAIITNSYSTGDLESVSYHSSKVGGLVGYLYSYGSSYTPPPGSTGVENNENLSSELAAGVDEDVMLDHCFAITNIKSQSTKYTAYAGRIVGEINSYAAAENVFYPSNVNISVETIASTPSKEKLDTTGKEVAHATFKNTELLSDTCGFDVENTWTFISDYDYPVLKCMVADKPLLKVTSYSFDKGVFDATIQVFANSPDFTVIIGVYNSRNQLIKAERVRFVDVGRISEFAVNYTGVDSAEYICISAIDTFTMTPFLEGLKKEL